MNKIDELKDQWVRLKAEEATARERRLAVEQSLIAMINDMPDEGTKTLQCDDGVKVRVTSKLTRRLDAARWADLRDMIPQPLADRLVRAKLELDSRELRYIRNNEPDYFQIIAPAITETPAKPSVTIVEK